MKINSQVNLVDVITITDWIVFAIILLLTFLAIIYGEILKKKDRQTNSFLDFMIMGRQLTLPMFTATLVATWYGGIFGVTKIAFNKGIYNFITQGVFWYISYIIFAFFLVEKITSYRAITLPDLIRRMFGQYSSKVAAVFNFFNVVPIAYTISLGLFIKAMFSYSLVTGMIIGVAIVILYSLWGGLRAVVFSDLIQFFVMCSAVFLVLLFSMDQFGGLGFLKENLPKGHWSPMGNENIGTTLVWGFIALSTLVDPNFYQRVFASESPKTAKKGILCATCIWLLFDLCTTFGAMYARAVIPQAEASNAYLTYAVQILPNGLRGLFLAGILATILSTLDSYLFLAATTLSFDFLPKKLKGKLIIHHLSVVVVGIVSIIMAISFKGNIKLIWKTLGSYSASCLLLPVIFGHIFPRKISDKQFVFSSLSGVIFTTLWRHLPRRGFWGQVDEIYIGIIATAMGLLLWHFAKKIPTALTKNT